MNLKSLAEKATQLGLIKPSVADDIVIQVKNNASSFFTEALHHDIDRPAFLSLSAEAYGLNVIDIDKVDIESLPLSLLADEFMDEQQMLPLSQNGNRLFVAVADPSNHTGLERAQFSTHLRVSAVLTDPRALNAIIQRLVTNQATTAALDTLPDDIDLSRIDEADTEAAEPDDAIDLDLDNPIVLYVNKVLRDAISQQASDVHIEPYENNARIRYRIDGMLIEAIKPSTSIALKIVSRLKVLAQLDIAERRLPQDGRMKIRFSRTRVVDFRISTMPTVYGEKMVIRIIDTAGADIGLSTIGMSEPQLETFKKATNQPHGMVLVTGPTGSGKTVTLYSALQRINDPRKNICTVEDPVEVNAEGINQVSINERAGLGFSKILRAFLRQDPDIIMVGEIRDLETAEIAIKASQTGHLVLSTLHTNDASSTVVRLLNMGIAPFNVASTLSLVIAQRLVRKLCASCKEPVSLPEEELLELGYPKASLRKLNIFEAVGCSGCHKGYRGRTGVFEVLPITEKIAEMIMTNATEAQIRRQARRDGVISLRQQGLQKVGRGLTSVEELERVTRS